MHHKVKGLDTTKPTAIKYVFIIIYFKHSSIIHFFTFDMDKDELKDIHAHFHLIMEHYPKVYANFKLNPTLPSAMSAHDKMESNLILL